MKDSIINKDNEFLLEYEIIRKCKDSIIQDLIQKKIHLFGNATISYGNIKISANKITIDWNKNTILAIGMLDSLGQLKGNPIFEEGEENFKATEILYNLKTKKCIIKKIITKEGEGFIHGLKVKKTETDILYLKRGEYTTCDHETPHYSLRANKIKITNKKQIITGPAYLTFFNIPTPLLLPFVYFPNTDKKSSGIIIPSYGESTNKGFFFKEGGYYFSLNDFTDLTIIGDIYTKGSWASKGKFRYKKRYKYNGYINLNYGNTINNDKGFPDYNIQKDLFINWFHKQDPKANPTFSFSANVNAGTSSFHKNNTFTNSSDYLTNTFSSSISTSKRWEGTPFNLSSSLSHNQNTQTHNVNLTLPEISFNMNKIYPLRNIRHNTRKKWYNNIGLRYSGNTKNLISNSDSLIFHKSTLRNFKTGMRHNIPISSSFKVLKYFTSTQSINISERWYLNKIEKIWDGTRIITDTINKFTRSGEYNLSSSINTKIYGISQFRKGRIVAFRHVITPNLSFTYNPSFSDEKYGFYKTVQTDSLGNTATYSVTENGIYGSSRKIESGNITFNLGNIIGLKVRNKKDTLEKISKITLIESMNINSSYDIFTDSMNLSNIFFNFRTKLFNRINISYSSVFDPYVLTENGRINKFELFENRRIARFKNSNLSVGFNINDKIFDKKEEKNDKGLEKDDFFKIPWNLTVNYTQTKINTNTINSITTSNNNLGFSGNIRVTQKWKLGFNSGYDFTDKNFTYTSLNIYRDLHCWELLFHLIPTGYRQSYTITIRVKADMLKDLKLERKKDWTSNY